jgi:hypothetical protein
MARHRTLVLPRRHLAAAAAVVLAVGLAAASATGWLPFGPRPVLAHVNDSLEGALYRIEGDSIAPLSAGDAITAGDRIRSAKGGPASLRLADGSVVEMAERSGLSLSRQPGRTVVDLERGRLIVRAEEQGSGRLAVSTSDCVASVQGTVFAVSRGTAGSRVTVLAGEVDVTDAGGLTTLLPGDQMVTGGRVPLVGLLDEVAWSGDADDYAELVAQLGALEGDVRAAFLPGGRTESRLLDLVPGDPVVYVAMPNIGRALAASQEALDRRLAESDALREWWQRAMAESGAEGEMREALSSVAALAAGLGDEIVIASGLPADDEVPPMVLLAEVADGPALDAAIDAEISRVRSGAPPGEAPALVVVDDPTALGSATGAEPTGADPTVLYLWRGPSVLVATPDPTTLRAVALAQDTPTGFRDTPFGSRVAEAYTRGVDWLLAADLARGMDLAIAEAEAAAEASGADVAVGPGPTGMLDASGMLDARYLIVGQKGTEDGARTDAALTFDGPRRGMAAWLAEPGPMGALRFLSPEALAAAAFVVAEPAQMLADLLAFTEAGRGDSAVDDSEGVSGEAIEVAEALAASLGGDVALALDGPVLPVPSWVAVIEVYDPVRLEEGLHALVALHNRAATETEHPPWRLEVLDRHASWVLHRGPDDQAVHAAVEDGYLVVAPSRALVERAVRVRRSGVSLADSEPIREGLRRDGNLNVSALVYQNAADSLAPVADRLGRDLDIAPSLFAATALDDEIRLYGDGAFALLEEPMLGSGAGLGGLLPLLSGTPAP